MMGQLVTGNYFDVLGVTPAIGRMIVPGRRVAAAVGTAMVLNYDTWQAAFGGDTDNRGQDGALEWTVR